MAVAEAEGARDWVGNIGSVSVVKEKESGFAEEGLSRRRRCRKVTVTLVGKRKTKDGRWVVEVQSAYRRVRSRPDLPTMASRKPSRRRMLMTVGDTSADGGDGPATEWLCSTGDTHARTHARPATKPNRLEQQTQTQEATRGRETRRETLSLTTRIRQSQKKDGSSSHTCGARHMHARSAFLSRLPL